MLLTVHVAAWAGPGAPCFDSGAGRASALDRTLSLEGNAESHIDLPASPRADLFVYAIESGVDAELEVRDSVGAVIATADSPVARAGIQRVFLPSAARQPAQLVVRGREHSGVTGTVRLIVMRPSAAQTASLCVTTERIVALADIAYAAARATDKVATTPSGPGPRGKLESVAAQYETAVGAFERAGLVSRQGDVELTLAALHYYDLQDWTKSAAWAQRAAATLQRAASGYANARAQAILAAAWLELATKSSAAGKNSDTPPESRALLKKSRALLAQLESFHAARHESYDRALQINNIGLAYYYEARFAPALEHFNRARAEFERIGETQRVAVALQNIALCEWGLGRLTAALPRFDRALSLMAPQPYPDLYLATLYSSALAHYAAGRFDDSLRLHGQAIDIAARLQLDRARARAYYGMGVTYYAIGDRELAARFLRSALDMLTPDIDARGRVAALRALATLEQETGQLAQAIAHDSEALRLATSPSARSRILLRLAMDYAAEGDTKAAMGVLNSLAAIAPNGDALVQALARVQRARLQRAAGVLEPARQDILLALKSLRRFEAITDEFEALVELGRIEKDAGNEGKALAALSDALNLTGEITAQTANPEYRASIAQAVRPALDLKIDLLWSRYERLTGDARAAEGSAIMAESLNTADASRAVAFEQLRAQRLDDRVDPRIADLQLSTAALYRDIADRRFQLATREDGRGANDPAAKALREDIARLRARLGVVNAELAARAAPEFSRATASREDWMARMLAAPDGKAFVEYWVGATSTYAWTVAHGRLSWVRLAPSAQIEQAARSLHDAMRSYASTPVGVRLDSSAVLYRLVFAPLRAQLTGTREITIVPDGPLHYVPFSTLRDATAVDKPYVAQVFAVAFAPALRLLSRPPSRPPAAWSDSRMLLVADPIYSADDPRLHRAASTRSDGAGRLSDLLRVRGGVDPRNLERLVSSARESEQIRALPGLRHVDLLEGMNATRANVLARNLADYRFIHFASHGIIDSEIPQLSALILGAWDRNGPVADQYVRAGDLLALTIDAEVVVLSACDTALGRQFGSEGPVGLRYAALARGARSVVASLWPVADAMAADLMTDMYRYITVDGYPVATALSAALRAALVRSPALDPALWGPFAVYVAAD